MTRKFLEDMGLTKEQIDKILDENSSDIGKAKGEVEGLKTQLETANKDKEGLEQQLEDTNKTLSDLQKSNEDAESLKTQISDLQNKIKTNGEKHNAEIQRLKVDAAVNSALTASKAKNIKAVKALLNLDNPELLEDGTIKGLDEQIKELIKAEDSKFLFDNSKPHMKGANVGENGNDDNEGKVDFSKMTYSEIIAFQAAHPDIKINYD